MPRGTEHETVNLGLLALQVATLGKYAASLPAGSTSGYLAGYLIGTLWVTPDLDLAGRRERPRPLQNWGLLKALWAPYGLIFKHRGLSHTWIIGPLTRALYLLFLAQGISYGLSLLLPTQELGFEFNLRGWLLSPTGAGVLTGYFVSQWLHLALDGIRPTRRRARR